MTDRRARLLEEVADLCRRETALEEAKKDSAAEFNESIKALKAERERLLKSLDQGADPEELPFDEDSKYPTPAEDLGMDDAPTKPDIDAGNFYDGP